MKIIATSDWHLGNLFHGNDRLQEHRHFFRWLLDCIIEEQPDALLVAGDVFDNGNPSAAAQSAYYELLADMTKVCPDMQIVITAGNHDQPIVWRLPVCFWLDIGWKSVAMCIVSGIRKQRVGKLIGRI